jgi:hypothetical protein
VKQIAAIVIALGLAGCASTSKHGRSEPPALSEVVLQNKPAAALAFTPPITLGTPELDLSRNGREPEAFWGYTQGETQAYSVQQDDVQYTDPWSGAYREAFSERSGLLSR